MHPKLQGLAAQQGGVFTTAQALAVGYSRPEVAALRNSGQWETVRRGVMADATNGRSTGANIQLLAAAALVVLSGDPILSHHSAARLWDLPIIGVDPMREPAVTVERQHRRRMAGVEVHSARTPPGHRRTIAGFPVTSPARTASDLARLLPTAAAVAAFDAALHRGLCTTGDVEAVVRDCWTWRGISRTKRALLLADARSESPGESLSRIAMISAQLPVPELQFELDCEGARYRTDFGWPAFRVVGEFDGRVKYGTAEALWQEKLREDAIRREGYQVVRWVWSEVYPDPTPMVRRLARALAARA